MTIWIPVILLRACIFGGNKVLIDGLLVIAAGICIAISDYEFVVVVSLQNVPLYLLLGLMVFLFSVVATTRAPLEYLRGVGRSVLKTGNLLQVGRCALTTAALEEVVWRVILQTVLSLCVGVSWAVIIIAISFSILHLPRTDGASVQLMEIFIFSLILGTLFVMTRDVLGVIVVHAIRNFLISMRGTHCES